MKRLRWLIHHIFVQLYVCDTRDENGVETFRFSGGKMDTERKYENGNGNLQNGSGNEFFYAETETKTERCFPMKLTWERNFLFP